MPAFKVKTFELQRQPDRRRLPRFLHKGSIQEMERISTYRLELLMAYAVVILIFVFNALAFYSSTSPFKLDATYMGPPMIVIAVLWLYVAFLHFNILIWSDEEEDEQKELEDIFGDRRWPSTENLTLLFSLGAILLALNGLLI